MSKEENISADDEILLLEDRLMRELTLKDLKRVSPKSFNTYLNEMANFKNDSTQRYICETRMIEEVGDLRTKGKMKDPKVLRRKARILALKNSIIAHKASQVKRKE